MTSSLYMKRAELWRALEKRSIGDSVPGRESVCVCGGGGGGDEHVPMVPSPPRLTSLQSQVPDLRRLRRRVSLPAERGS